MREQVSNIKGIILQICCLSIFSTTIIGQKNKHIINIGIDYRTYPIDIEDTPVDASGGLQSSTYGDLTGDGFWKTISIHGRYGVLTKKKWCFSIAAYARYNHNHYTKEPYYVIAPTVLGTDPNTPDKSKLKIDLFLDIEKKITLKKNRENYLFFIGGVGLTNINSGTDIDYIKNNYPGGSQQPARYKGNFLNFGPRFSVGYQHNKIKGSLDAYFIEDPGLTDLLSLWFGVTISYEIALKRKK
jgi:hypothetical protein